VRSRISEAVFRRFLRHVSADLTAVQIAQRTGLNRNTVNRLLAGVRLLMAEAYEDQKPFTGTVEVDQSYFGPRRVKGMRARGAARIIPVLGIYKRQGHVYTEPVPDCSQDILLGAIRGKVSLDSSVCSDGMRRFAEVTVDPVMSKAAAKATLTPSQLAALNNNTVETDPDSTDVPLGFESNQHDMLAPPTNYVSR
jgi:hypothetical protein